MQADYQFNDAPRRTSSTFDPEAQYARFKTDFGRILTYDIARVFFTKQKAAKAALRGSTKQKVDISFGGMRVTVYNNHNPQNERIDVPDTAYTLHRLSGFIAKWLMEKAADQLQLEAIMETVVVPLAELKGCKWENGAALYLSFCPGTEMFLETFQFFPLAIEIQRVLKDQTNPVFMRKALRQKYGAKTAEEWMESEIDAVKRALETVQQLPWARAGFSAAARTFLSKFNITV
ncbi:nucleoprotein [Parker's Farm virus]|nr:nucleoprotein [Parker's Farm virus]